MPKKKAVVVTTEFRGVFFGYLAKSDGDVAELTGAKNCIYWTADVKGFIGLATKGPVSGCKIGPAAPRLKLNKVTAVIDCTKEAEEAWNKEIW